MSNQLEEEPTPYGKAGTFAPAGSGVTERAKDVASEAGQQTKQVATEAHEQAREVVSEVRNRTRDLVGQTQAELRDQAELRTQRAAEGLRTLGQQLEALRQGRPEEAGLVGGYVDQAQRNVADIADRLDRDGFEAVISDLSSFARRRPGVFILTCAFGGFMLARAVRTQAGGQPDGTGAQGAGVPAGQPPPPSDALLNGPGLDPYGVAPPMTPGQVQR